VKSTMRSIVVCVLLAILPAVLATDVAIASTCFGYSVNGATCASTGLPTITLAAGAAHTFTISGTMAAHPLVIVTATSPDPPTAATLYSGASPNPTTGTSSGVVTITIPATEPLTTLYYMCSPHGFFGTITVTGAVAASSSTGSSVVSSSTGSTSTSYTITAPCFGYSINGATCTADTGTALTLAPGTYTFVTGTGLDTHPVVFSKVAGSVAAANLYSGASPNPSTGNQPGVTITLTIPTSDAGKSLYYTCVPHLFYGTITVSGTATTSSTASSMTSSTGVNAATSLSPALAIISLILAAFVAIKA